MEPPSGKENAPTRRTRSAVTYSIEHHCLLCGNPFQSPLSPPPPRSRGTGGICKIGSMPTKSALIVMADRRRDDWGATVKSRLVAILDAKSAMKLRYHRSCVKSFFNPGRQLSPSSQSTQIFSPSSPSPPAAQRPRLSRSASMTAPLPSPTAHSSQGTPRPPGRPPLQVTPLSRNLGRGRPIDSGKQQAFEKLCADLESSANSQFNMSDLLEKLSTYNPISQYTEKSLKTKLQEKYKGVVTFSSLPNKKTVLTFKRRASEILCQTYLSERSAEDAKNKIKEVAKMISNEIVGMQYNCDHYPSVADIQDGGRLLVPESLLFLLEEIVKTKKPAAGHLNYSKSIPLYLHLMSPLKDTLSEAEYDAFVTKGNFTVRRSAKFWAGIPSDQTIEQVLMAALKDQGGVTRGRGMTDATIATFVKTMPLCSRITRALRRFAGLNTNETPEQHLDLRPARQRRDHADLQKLCEYLRAHSPLTKPRNEIVSVSTGIVGDASINCDQAIQRGKEILKKIAGKNFGEVKLHRKDRVIPLSAMTSSIKIGDSVVPVNVNQLFHRIIVLKMSDEELSECFAFELAPYPTALFDCVTIRKSNKAALIKVLDRYSAPSGLLPQKPSFIIDGGHLLHSVGWPRPATFGEVAMAYLRDVTALLSKYGGVEATIVFDGYPEGPSTKDVEHLRRAVRTSTDVAVEEGMTTTTTQALFLMNSVNKERLIRFLSDVYQRAGIAVKLSQADADRDIVTTAILAAKGGKTAVIVGEDTDLLVLMLGLTPQEVAVHLMSCIRDRPVLVRNSQELQAALGEVVDHILFLHAMTGCDTTSFPFKRSKKNGLGKLLASESLRQTIGVFNDQAASLDQITAAGEMFLLSLYGFPATAGLARARYLMYKRVIARQPIHAKFDPATLPPTPDGAKWHSARVYHQVQAWRGNDLDPTAWGWQVRNNKLIPVRTSIAPAPQRVLKLIYCGCGTPCVTNQCECQRSGLRCSSMCGRCAGVSCQNAATSPEEDDSSDEEGVDDPEAFLEMPDDVL